MSVTIRRKNSAVHGRSFSRFLAVFLALQCAWALGDAPPQQPLIPTESFTRFDEFGGMKISPDGEFIALTIGKYGRSALVFFDLKAKKLGGGVRATEGFEIDEFYWVSPTRLVYLIAERQSGLVAPVRTGEILAVDRDGKNRAFLYGYRAGEMSTGTKVRVKESSYSTPEIISILKGDEKNILIAEHPWREQGRYWRRDYDAAPRIVRLNVQTGYKRSMGGAPLRSAELLVDRNEEVRVAYGRNEQFKLAVSWKPTPGGEWTVFELPGFREESIAPMRFEADNRSVLFTGVRTDEQYAALYRLDLQTREAVKVHAFENTDVDGVISDFADRESVGVHGYTDRPVHHWLVKEDPAAQLYAGLERAFKGQSATVTSATDAGDLAVVFVYSDTNPGDYYLFDIKTKNASYLRGTRAWIDPARMRPKQPIQVTARDGLTLHGYLTQPAGVGPHPLVVLPHGGPHGIRDTWGFDWEAQLLANRGYAVLQVNFRGSGGYGMDFMTAGYRQWGASMQDDVTDATRWAIEQKITTADRICIFGASYGAFASLMGAAREPDLYRCAVGYAGVYDLELMLSSADIPDSRSGRSYLKDALGDDVADLRARSPVHNAERIKAPVMLIHGKADWRADYEQAERMKSALEKHRKSVEWMALSREGHGVYDEDSRREVYERILTFLDKHLMGAAAASP